MVWLLRWSLILSEGPGVTFPDHAKLREGAAPDRWCMATSALFERRLIRMTDDREIPIGHLQRRKIESRVLIPFIEACRERFGEGATRELVIATIRRLAAEDGAKWGQTYGRSISSLRKVAEDVWAGAGSLDIDIVGESDDRLDFNVTRCRYAEFYKELGLADLGYLVHCNRDHAMIAGFSPELELTRTQTLMEGASHCDFRFRAKK